MADLVGSKDSQHVDPRTRLRARTKQLFATDKQLQAMSIKTEVYEAAAAPDVSLEKAIDLILKGYSERDALGQRTYEIVTDNEGRNIKRYLPAFSMVTYGELRKRIRAIASAWQNEPTLAVEADDMVVLIGFSGTEYTAIDTAITYAQAVSVPLQSAAAKGELDEVIANIDPVAIAATIDDLALAAQLAVQQGNVRSLIAFDYDERDDAARETFEDAQKILQTGGVSTRLVSHDKLVEIGKQYTWEFLPDHKDGAQKLALIMHSSGSTGKPKGAMFTAATIKEFWNASNDPGPNVAITFAPMNHNMGRVGLIVSLRKGSTVYFTLKPDMSTLFEDIRLCRPTRMAFFPRIVELIYSYYQNEVAKRVRAGDNEAEAQNLVKAEMRYTFLGDRLLAAIVGSAPISPLVKAFLVDCFQIYLVDGYSNTEAGAGSIAMNGVIQRPNVIDYKLRDVPELGYYTTDKPYPRGELCYKTQFQVMGYYKDAEATANLLDDEGFSLTGDIVEERAPDHIVIIDRRKDVLKLSQGEYVAVGPLGAVFEAGSSVINQIYVYGNSLQSYLLAVVVPDEGVVIKVLGDAYSKASLNTLIRDELQKVAKEEGLKSFEVPRDFIIEREAFSQGNGLLSSVLKRLRPAIKRKYGTRLEAIYTQHEENQKSNLDALKDTSSALTISEKIGKLVEIELSVEDVDVSKARTFKELGGDSLAAVSFSLAVEEIFGISLPADSIMSPTGSVANWAKEIEALLDDAGTRPTFDRVHGKGATALHAKDLQLEKFIDKDVLSLARSAGPMADTERTVLLTGANGFLGRTVCLQWMEKVAKVGGKVVCLVRGGNDDLARERLDKVFSGASPDFETHYNQLAEKHLEVLAGDFGQPLLGLDEATFKRLTDEVDRVCHVGALVNHRLSYQHLFGPNVAGTAEIIRLAITGHLKPVDFVSTIAVMGLLDSAKDGNESAAPVETAPLSDGYAAGYAVSKWAGEHLLRRATTEFGLEVNIMRGPMMLPHQTFSGVINTADMFTRLLYSLIVTGLAPKSFYQLAADGNRISGHYDGLPVDVVAASVIAPSNSSHSECRGFNITNYHADDGCSLDAFVDWIESAGYPITRIEEHSEWFQRFSEKLKSLPEQQKQHSAVDVMGAYANPHGSGPAVHVDCAGFKSLAGDLSTGSDIPSLDETYIHKCLKDLQALGLIEAPTHR